MNGKVPHEPRLHARGSPARRYGRRHRRGRTHRRHRTSRSRTGFLPDRDLQGGCLEIADGSTHNGAPLQQYRCLGTDSQLFTTEDTGDGDGSVRIKTFAGKCLEILYGDPSGDDTIVQGDCDDRYSIQEFQIHDLEVVPYGA
ncbi:RICIN domain-containing protein [Streptomyces griseorubiginosus]|uniref:RICIN domain-containing protein n=1 Tax=Streptomyces griseorubiginosus TaxID=67304 RepID=UPI00339F44F8